MELLRNELSWNLALVTLIYKTNQAAFQICYLNAWLLHKHIRVLGFVRRNFLNLYLFCINIKTIYIYIYAIYQRKPSIQLDVQLVINHDDYNDYNDDGEDPDDHDNDDEDD